MKISVFCQNLCSVGVRLLDLLMVNAHIAATVVGPAYLSLERIASFEAGDIVSRLLCVVESEGWDDDRPDILVRVLIRGSMARGVVMWVRQKADATSGS